MPRSFSAGGGWGRRPDAKLFSVPYQQTANVEKQSGEKSYDIETSLQGGVLDESDLQSFVGFLIQEDPALGKLTSETATGLRSADFNASPLQGPRVDGFDGMDMDMDEPLPPLRPQPINPPSANDPFLGVPNDPFAGSPAAPTCFGPGLLSPPMGPSPPLESLMHTGMMSEPKPSPWGEDSMAAASPAPHVEANPMPAPEPPAPDEAPQGVGGTTFNWTECPSIIGTDALGAPLRMPPAAAFPAVKLSLRLQMPLLLWKERQRWLWHKKWSLPKLHASVTVNGQPVSTALGGAPPLSVIISAGTLRDDGRSLRDQGLAGETQRCVVGGECTFSSLFFQHTSFNCGNRPFHIVASVLAPAHHPLAVAALAGQEAVASPGQEQAMVVLACVCSSPIVVDARKRTKGERPDAAADDVRIMQRRSNGGGGSQRSSSGGEQSPYGGNGRHPANHQQRYSGGQQQQQQQQPHGQSWGGPGQQQQPPFCLAPSLFGEQQGMPPLGQPPPRQQWPLEGPIELEGDLCIIKRVLSEAAFGYPASQLVGESVLKILHPNDHMGMVSSARALLCGGAPQGVVSGKVLMFCRSPASGQSELAVVELSLTALNNPLQNTSSVLMSARRVAF